MGDAPSATSVLQATQVNDPDTVDAAAWLRFSDDGVAAAAALLGQTGLAAGARWAAVYVYGNGGEDPAPLVPYAADPDPSVRLIAAAALIARGRGEGFAPAVDALTDTSMVTGTLPPCPSWVLAAQTLVRATARADLGPPLDADDRLRRLSQDAWRRWLTDERPALHFDATTGLWS